MTTAVFTENTIAKNNFRSAPKSQLSEDKFIVLWWGKEKGEKGGEKEKGEKEGKGKGVKGEIETFRYFVRSLLWFHLKRMYKYFKT